MMERVFWGWEESVLAKAVAHLTAGGGGFDLTDQVLVVPTSEAGRRLRRALAEAADGVGKAATVPQVWVPDLCLVPPKDRGGVATGLEVRLAWHRALQRAPLAKLKRLFPKLPEETDWRWCGEMAVVLAEVQGLVGAGGWRLSEVAAGEEVMERDRWQDLAVLEGWFDVELGRLGRKDPEVAKRQRADSPWLPEGVTKVTVLAAADLPPLMGRWLRGCEAMGRKVVVCVHAPAGEAGSFDEIGRPTQGGWGEQASRDLGVETGAIHVCTNPVQQAERVMERLRGMVGDGERAALGVCDGEVASVLREKLMAEKVAVFEPGGMAVKEEGFWHVLETFHAFCRGGTWAAFATLMRVPEVRKAWVPEGGLGVLRELDDFAGVHLPALVEGALELVSDESAPKLGEAMRAALGMRRRMGRGTLSDAARAWLVELWGEETFETESPAVKARLELADQWLAEVAAVEETAGLLGLEADRDALWGLAMERLGQRRLSAVRGEVDLVLQGWLELLWEEAPALVVGGVNEENVPGVMISHPFLPDRFRASLGLPCQATRFARDAYLMAALVAQRVRMEWVCGQWSEQGDVRRPSRLLLLTSDEELTRRVRHVLPKERVGDDEREPPRSLGWVLRPRGVETPLAAVSATQLAAYLDCPFRYYLERVLKMEAVGQPGREMDALQFGNLVHAALKALAEDEGMRGCGDERTLAAFLEGQVRGEAAALFGRLEPPLVRLQVDAAVQRLRHHAAIEARSRAEGWEIVAAEWAFGPALEKPLIIEGAVLRGMIDRVEQHTVTGNVRVIDFKTSDKAESPLQAHCLRVRRIEAGEEWRHGVGEIAWRWRSLQLPLYAAALTQAGRWGRVTEVGYGCLPKGVQGTELKFWDGFSEGRWQELGVECAAEVVRRIRAGIFWPPSSKSANPRFEELFVEGVARSAVGPGGGDAEAWGAADPL